VNMSYMNKILWVDLSKRTSCVESLPDELKIHYIGGKGFGIERLTEIFPKGDPFEEQNPLIFGTGPLTGTIAPCMRACVVSKSPLTGTFCDSYFGGHFGQEIKYAGYDVIIVTGRAEEPTYLFIEDDRVEIRKANHLWGKETDAVYHEIKKELGDATIKVSCIGPAGEKKVRFAMIDCDFHRHAGRGGLGAVMGSKNLKAVALKGTHLISVYDPERFAKAVWEANEALKGSEGTRALTQGGTVGACFDFSNSMGFLPVKNFSGGVLKPEIMEKVEIAQHQNKLWLRDNACAGCPIRCAKIGRIREGAYKDTICDNIEYETLGLMAGNLEWMDLGAISFTNWLCDNLGIDTMSVGAVIGFTMEAFERGILTKKDLDGLEPRFGESATTIELIRKIARREGIGDILAEGVQIASERIGKGSDELAVHVKGLESPAWGPRGSSGMGLAYMTGDRGGCHQRAFPIAWESLGQGPQGDKLEPLSQDKKAELVAWEQNLLAAYYSLVSCEFGRTGISTAIYLHLLSGATGLEFNETEFLKVGERIWNRTRLYNNGNGVTRKDDYLPKRFEEPIPDGPHKGHCFTRADQDRLLDEYYKIRGWDSNGVPTSEKLKELGIDKRT